MSWINIYTMLQVIAEKKALSIIKRYYNMVEKTGYVKHEMLCRYMKYLFLIDLVEYTHDFFTQKDYDTVAEALAKLFSDGGCLLPYPVMCANRATLGRAHYMGTYKVRVTEGERYINRSKRITEDENLRTV